jgi:hypothetical protein
MAVNMSSTIFWDMTPCSLVKRFGGTYLLHLQNRRISHTSNKFGLLLDPNDEAVRSSVMLAHFYQTTWRHTVESNTLQVKLGL